MSHIETSNNKHFKEKMYKNTLENLDNNIYIILNTHIVYIIYTSICIYF